MEPFVEHKGIAAPLLRINIDTDAIIPSREMKKVSKEGLGEGLFANWRYSDPGKRTPNPDFVLNKPEFERASILIGGVNFGCGSSREHAVWALKDFGIRAVIAPSFGSIFYGNCTRNGILPVVLDEADVTAIGAEYEQAPGSLMTISLPAQSVTTADGTEYAFQIGAAEKEMLIEGLDPISATLKMDALILEYQRTDRENRPWIYLEPTE